ncbi:hypothetical protein AGLY_017727 [Aphis glycines]|uniref:SPIN-DOC-like zinc-finger domain-containing protein n=1 Tax=Aphis glycines TaxID=307491 RepID=A0A6G0SU52_APHGL|nr:hypothetical protein AGLY_017727 [Aphis glycines]
MNFTQRASFSVTDMPVVSSAKTVSKMIFFLAVNLNFKRITMNVSKKRKIDSECRVFNKWINQYFVIENKEKVICLVCRELISVLKEYNIKRHYESKHKVKYDSLYGQQKLLLLLLVLAVLVNLKRIQRPRERAVRCFRDPQAHDVLTTPTTSSRRSAAGRRFYLFGSDVYYYLNICL